MNAERSAREELAALISSEEKWRPTWQNDCAQFVVGRGPQVLALIDAVEDSFLFEPGRREDAALRGRVFRALRDLNRV